MEFQALLHCHSRFVDFCREKESVLSLVEQLFPPRHPLLNATARALLGDPLSAFRLRADDLCCRSCCPAFTQLSKGLACTQLFYGTSLKALVAGEVVAEPSCEQQSQCLSLAEWSRIAELPFVADGFMRSVRAFKPPPRIERKLNACEARFQRAWQEVVRALRGVRVDVRQTLLIHIVLRRLLPAEIAAIVLQMCAPWPITLDDSRPEKKRRRRA